MRDFVSRDEVYIAIASTSFISDPNYADGKVLLYEEDLKHRIDELPSAEPKIDDENELKFYYVESLDDYWIGGVRIGNFYYATWCSGIGFVWSHSRYLPWGEHVVDETTLWKEHTYPSEPIEIPFTKWIVGFVKKYFAEPKTGRWMDAEIPLESGGAMPIQVCDQCSTFYPLAHTGGGFHFCPNCGAKMLGEEDDNETD